MYSSVSDYFQKDVGESRDAVKLFKAIASGPQLGKRIVGSKMPFYLYAKTWRRRYTGRKQAVETFIESKLNYIHISSSIYDQHKVPKVLQVTLIQLLGRQHSKNTQEGEIEKKKDHQKNVSWTKTRA